MKNSDVGKANASKTSAVKDFDAEIEDVIKAAEEETSTDPGDKYRIWRCNGLPVAVRFHNKRS